MLITLKNLVTKVAFQLINLGMKKGMITSAVSPKH